MSTKHVETLRKRLSNSIALPFRDILPEDMIQQILEEKNIKYRKRLWLSGSFAPPKYPT